MLSGIGTKLLVGEIYCYSYLSVLKLDLFLNRILHIVFPTRSTVSRHPLLSPTRFGVRVLNVRSGATEI
jgi:hypothetical protein